MADTTHTDWTKVLPMLRMKRLKVFVKRSSTDRIYARIDELRRRQGADLEPGCVMVMGEQGIGKSTTLQQLVLRDPPRSESGRLIRPVLYIELAANASPLAAARAMVKEQFDTRLDVSFPKKKPSPELAKELEKHAKGTLDALTDRIVVHLQAQETGLVIFDDFQQTIDGRSRTVNRGADWIKVLTKSTGNITVVLAGTDKIAELITENDQLEGITPSRFKLGRFKYTNPADKKAFQDFLAELDAELPFNKPAGLSDPNVAKAIFDITQGHLRTFSQMLVAAGQKAIERNSPVMTFDDLSHGYRSIALKSKVRENPFANGRALLKEAA